MSVLRRIALVGLVFLLVAMGGRAAVAQVVDSRTSRIVDPMSIGTSSGLADLEKFFVEGNYPLARTTANEMLKTVLSKCCPKNDDSIYVIWIGKSGAGAAELHRLLLTPAGSRPYSPDLFGAGTDALKNRVLEIYLATDAVSEVVSNYRSTRVDNPMTALLPAFASQILTPMFGIIAATTHSSARGAAASPIEVWASVYRVILPFRRATIAISSWAVLTLTYGDIMESMGLVRDQILNDSSVRSDVARKYAADLPNDVLTALKACQVPVKAGEDPISWPACQTSVEHAMAERFKKACGELGESCKEADLKVADAVQVKFRAAVKELHQTLTADVTISNTPPTHFSLGSMTAVTTKAWASSTPRVKMDSNNLAADPLGRTLTAVVVNWSPVGYDSEAYRLAPAKWPQAFAGAIIAPDIGIAIGATQTIVKGFAVNFGYGWIYSRGLRPEDQIGKPPNNPNEAFALAISHVLFVGGSVNFTGK